MSRMKETLDKRQEELYEFIREDDVALEDMYDVEEVLTEVHDFEPAESMEWMARFAMGIKFLTINTEYDTSIFWSELGNFIREGADSGESLEKTWKDFKEEAMEKRR